MRLGLVAAASVLLLGMACTSSAAQPTADPAAAADVRMLASEMERIHPNLFHSVSQAEFRRAVDDLVGRLPGLERDPLLVEVLRIVAMTGERDGHMGLFPLMNHARPLHLAPIRVWAFPEGMFVVASPEQPGLVGSRLVAIEGRPVDEVAALVRPLVTRDNESSLILRLPEFMLTGEILHGLGIASSAAEVGLTLERANGERVDVRLSTLAGPAYWDLIQHVWAPPPPPGVATPLWLRNGQQVAVVRQAPARARRLRRLLAHDGADGRFATALLKRARAPKVRRVDRRCPSQRGRGQHDLLPASQRPPQPRREQAGAARSPDRTRHLLRGGQLRGRGGRGDRARIVGEAAGGSPHNYGDAVDVVLPALGWTVHVPPQYVEVLGRPDERVVDRA